MRFNFPKGEVASATVTKVFVWYDTAQKLWCLQRLNAAGDQVGEAEWFGYRVSAKNRAEYITSLRGDSAGAEIDIRKIGESD